MHFIAKHLRARSAWEERQNQEYEQVRLLKLISYLPGTKKLGAFIRILRFSMVVCSKPLRVP